MRSSVVLLSVALCGGIGAVLRYSISAWANQHWATSFPLGTFLVNMIGCCLLGALSQAAELTESISPTMKTALGVGLLGALTTFSTFGAETLKCIHDGNWTVAFWNVAANVLVGLIAVAVGASIARSLLA